MKISELKLKEPILKAVGDLGFVDVMPIQEKCIPEIMAGKDLFGHSSTGSGKTAAFGLPILEKIHPGHGLQVLVLTPTRELCVQVSEALQSFGKYIHIRVTSVYGGVGINPQIDAIPHSDIIVGTPGRILDHLRRGTLSFEKVKFLVLDEADKMFEMGFIDDVEEIIRHVPKERQTLLFSATLPAAVFNLVKKHMKSPISIKSEVYVDKSLLKQGFYVIDGREKFSLLVHLLKKNTAGLSMIFCATRHEVDILNRNLRMQGIHGMAIHGGLSQNKRSFALDSLKKEKINVLVCTDVAARGLDIRSVTYIYNYDVPKTSDEYVHRIGRTARAGDKGEAITLLCDRDYDNFNRVLTDRSLDIKKEEPIEFPQVRFDSGRDRFRQRPGFHRGPRSQSGSSGYRGRSPHSSSGGRRSGWGLHPTR